MNDVPDADIHAAVVVALAIGGVQRTQPKVFGCGALERFQDPYRTILSLTCDLLGGRISGQAYAAKLAPYLKDDAVRTWLREVFLAEV